MSMESVPFVIPSSSNVWPSSFNRSLLAEVEDAKDEDNDDDREAVEPDDVACPPAASVEISSNLAIYANIDIKTFLFSCCNRSQRGLSIDATFDRVAEQRHFDSKNH
uniref:Uncharacterized protein n=1 Tax=Romanomermis culicivorax TaxID=13658 RepID=A0A915II28_ROMCU